jgi:hypothetical protein
MKKQFSPSMKTHVGKMLNCRGNRKTQDIVIQKCPVALPGQKEMD